MVRAVLLMAVVLSWGCSDARCTARAWKWQPPVSGLVMMGKIWVPTYVPGHWDCACLASDEGQPIVSEAYCGPVAPAPPPTEREWMPQP